MLADEGRANDGDDGEEYDEDDSDIEDQALYATPRFKYRASACTTKGTTKSRAAYLQQDKRNNGDAQHNLNHADRRKPLLNQEFFLSFVSTLQKPYPI
jgi:hypothetical protein